MFDLNILFFLIIVICSILFIILFIILIKNNNISEFKFNNLVGIIDFFKNDFSNENIYYEVTSEKISQQRLTVLSILFYFNIYFKNSTNYSIIETFNANYEQATSNWYIKNIGIPKFFIYGIYLNRKSIFTKNNKKNIDLIISLLDKIFISEQDIKDDLSNGINVASYNITYVKLQNLYPEFLKKYSCHENQTYMNKCYKLFDEFKINSVFNENGFYVDYSYIYHTNGPNTMSYLYSTLEDYAFLKKNNILKLNEKNVNLILNCFKPFINNKIVFYNIYGRGITRKRVQRYLYMTFLYLNELKENFVEQYNFDLVNYPNIKKNVTKTLKNYLMPFSGLYISYGKELYDNYYITSLNKLFEIETVTTENDGDLFNINSNMYNNFLFGDDETDVIYRFHNNLNKKYKKIILSGCLLLENQEIINEYGWITNFNCKNKNIEIVFCNYKPFIYIYIIDKRNNIMTVVLNEYQKNEKIIQVCGMSLYSIYDIYTGDDKEKNCFKIISDKKTRYLYSNLSKTIIENNSLSTLSFCYVLLNINYENKYNNIFHVTNNKTHKLPTVENSDNYLKYDNGVEKFSLKKNIQPEEYNITYSDKKYDLEKMFVLEFEKEKILQYCNYPYYSNTPLTANNKKFILDDNYRYYINL